jgi:hypothetical protein
MGDAFASEGDGDIVNVSEVNTDTESKNNSEAFQTVAHKPA